MSNPIPPLVCDTPPPIDDDFEPFDDDFGAFEGAEETISPREEKLSTSDGKFDLPVPEIPNVVEPLGVDLPIRREEPLGESVESPKESKEDILEESSEKSRNSEIPGEEVLPEQQELRLSDDVTVKRCESPPSLVLSEDFSCFPEDVQAEDNSNSGDEVSLPSLHLDSGGVSKSVTPTFTPHLAVPDNIDSNFAISEDDKVGHDDETEENFDDFAEFSSAPVTDDLARLQINQEPAQEIPQEFGEFSSSATAAESVSIPNEVIDFVADFSQFDAASEVPANVVVSDSENQSTRDNQPEDDDDDDDEFGDFSDFQQTEAATEAVIDTTNLNSQFQSALNFMFPKVPNPEEEEEEEQDATGDGKIDTKFVQQIQMMEELRDFEASKALQYQWLNSTSNQYLIRSLGIDSRNILYGGKWNSSMPRFAANLGFSPLQPMKPGPGASSTSSSAPNQQRDGSEMVALPATGGGGGVSEVPAAQFDWTSSGLVNPLDGAPKVLPKSDDPKDPKEQPELAATTTSAAPVAAASDSSESQSDDIHVAKEVSGGSVRPGATNILPQSFSQPLRETHIFTPSKSSNPVSREVSDHASVAESKIVVKEYRDVEYNPEKVARVDDDDFSDFTEFKGSSGVEEVGVGKKVPTIESPYRIVDKVVDFTKPTFGVSPTEEMVNGRGNKMKGDQGEEDDFCDFQSVTPQHSTKNSQTIAPILQPLNVMKLPESTPKIAWPSPGINPDEMARLEAIFPQKRSASLPLSEKVAIIETKTTEKSKDDDEWSDFVSGNNISSTSNRDDDWTDFMSGTPSAPPGSSQKSLQQGPNFSSWTTPQLPPPQFTAWHHSNIFSQPPQYGPGGVQKATVAPQMINNNHLSKGNGQINGFPLVPPSLSTISTGNAMYQRPRRPQTDTPSISVIPDMSFRAPKSLIQLPRSNYAKK
ncbi:uncharacterized protein LOC129805971 [Phlebotomus papatasi]|uniref:uncharacterized protein LOC129805971 n=1 Tax=Phlebotomus papatasi TaxID=29031 RepID=UPI0024836491|nr:uncharacterized protein LOC129805971 [Phlebotomus papatasi]